MADIVERMKWWAAKRRPPRGMPTLPADCAEAADEIERLSSWNYDQATEIETLRSRCAALEKALEPFAKAGQVIDGPFGPALFAEDDMAFQSGCAWSENGERRTITWGDFRRARAALTEAKGSES